MLSWSKHRHQSPFDKLRVNGTEGAVSPHHIARTLPMCAPAIDRPSSQTDTQTPPKFGAPRLLANTINGDNMKNSKIALQMAMGAILTSVLAGCGGGDNGPDVAATQRQTSHRYC